MTTAEHIAPAPVETLSHASRSGAALDENHAPETNGRMAVCRRCGIQTDGPHGRHTPHEPQLARADEWLRREEVQQKIALLSRR